MMRVPASRYLVFFGLVIVGCVSDLWTKHLVFEQLGMPSAVADPYWLIDGVFGFQTSLNEGALFGLGQGFVPVFACLSVMAAIGITAWLFWAGAARDLLLTVSLGMITAGIFGNLFDRLGMPGLSWNYATDFHEIGEPVYAVRDWILVMIGSYHWPNFNIADSLLVCGAALLAYHAIFTSEEEDEATATDGEASEAAKV